MERKDTQRAARVGWRERRGRRPRRWRQPTKKRRLPEAYPAVGSCFHQCSSMFAGISECWCHPFQNVSQVEQPYHARLPLRNCSSAALGDMSGKNFGRVVFGDGWLSSSLCGHRKTTSNRQVDCFFAPHIFQGKAHGTWPPEVHKERLPDSGRSMDEFGRSTFLGHAHGPTLPRRRRGNRRSRQSHQSS